MSVVGSEGMGAPAPEDERAEVTAGVAAECAPAFASGSERGVEYIVGMGSFWVEMAVGDAAGGRFETVRALADTGAAWTWLPRELLEGLGHKPTLKRRLQTADNRIIERDAGMVTVRIGDEALPTLCVFGDTGSMALLGATTLQQFSLAADPVNERLVPIVGMLATLLE